MKTRHRSRSSYKHTRRSRRKNPRGRSSRASRARSWHRSVRESLPWWEKGRKNPRSGKARYHRRVLRKLSSKRRRGVIDHALGQMNPKGHRGSRRKARHHRAHLVRGGGKHRVYEHRAQKRGKGRRGQWARRNPAQFPMPFVSAMNPGRRSKRGRRR